VANPQNVVVILDPLPLLQARFALLKLGGELRLVDRDEVAGVLSGKRSGDIDFYKTADANKLLARFLETIPSATPPKLAIEQFWKNPNTHVYDAVAFSPKLTLPETLNYWVPSPIVPAQGNASLIHAYLLDLICDGDRNLCRYVLRFMAHMLQRPEEKPGVMLIMLGGQGTGKGTFFHLLNAIWPRTFLQVSDINHVVGNFNACLERHYVVCMDEALFAGDKRAVDRLKSLVTEPVVAIEQKYQPRRTIDSYHRFIAASNSDHFAHTDRDDRRFLYLRVSSARQGDHAYFDALHKAIDDPAVISAFVHDLLNINLTGFNVRRPPKTQEHVAQKLQSLEGFDRFWYEVLLSGGFVTNGSYGVPDRTIWDTARFIGTERLREGCRYHFNGLKQYKTLTAQDIAHSLKKLCPEATPNRREAQGKQERGYDLPSLEVARRAFEGAIGGPIDWGDGESARTPLSTDGKLHAVRETYHLDPATAA